MHIEGIYMKNLFFNSEKGQSSFLIKPKEGTCEGFKSEKGYVKVVGKFCLQQRYMPLSITGEWKYNDFGPEFHISTISEGVSNLRDTEIFIRELGVEISKRNISKILQITGTDIFKASKVKDIEEMICQATNADPVSIIDTFTRIRHLSKELELFRLLDRYNGSYEHCCKILKKFPENPVGVLQENPYSVLENVNVPFSLIDQIALDNGVDALSESRIKAIILWCIRRESNSGNVYMKKENLCKMARRVYGDIPDSAIIAALEDHPYITRDENYPDYYYESRLLKDEKLAAKEFARLMYTKKELPFHPEYIKEIEDERGFAFGSHQRSAFYLLQTTGIKLLTGDPGTGKTTTVNGLLKYLERVWEEAFGTPPVFALCAPAGRAAQRMKETTARNAQTIHKLLEYQPYGNSEYYKDGNDPIEADVIIVDEVSMLGLSTFSKLLAAIKNGCLVLLVGDTNQLQSVEPGCVLQDIINSGYVDSCHLTEVFRQAAESNININAKKVICGDEELGEGKDFQIIQTSKEQIPDVLTATVNNLLVECNGDQNKIQVLAPVKKGSCGVKEGNRIVQELFNPAKGGIWHGYKNYKLNDRIIMLSNNYASGYYNGDVGYIRFISDNSVLLEIGDEKLSLGKEAFSDMDLAYFCTVHKSQGSEYEYLIIVLQEDAKGMLDQNLLYTAITRGKKKVVILYEGDALKTSIRTKKSGNRNSLLVERINEEMCKLYS